MVIKTTSLSRRLACTAAAPASRRSDSYGESSVEEMGTGGDYHCDHGIRLLRNML